MAAEGLTRRGALARLGLAGAAAACGERPEAPAYAGKLAFLHGVASGDPGPDRVIIWTRVTPERDGPVPVRWVVARNRDLSDVVFTGVYETSAARDYTVKVDVADLRAGAPYFYGFLAGDQQSQVGKTRTLSRGSVDEMKIAVASCASFPHGFFNVYEAIGAREDVDLVVHLGDYIYEYGLGGYGGDSAVSLGRIPSPEIECVAIEDYRQRHAQYKAEPELQAAHARAPWIVVWDDHETANDSWSAGADNHDPENNEGEWAARKRASLQAYYEWMPIRDPEPGRPFEAIQRSFTFGDLFTLVMLETRLMARTRQFDMAREAPLQMARWDFSNPAAPRPMRTFEPDGPHVRLAPIPFEQVGREWVAVYDWARVATALANPRNPPNGLRFAPDLQRLQAMLSTPDRVLLGDAQQQWLAGELKASKQAGIAWRIIGNQVIMAPVAAPDLSAAPAELAAQLERLRPGITQLLAFTRYPIPLNVDSWDGYPAARARVFAAMRASGADTLVLSGDSHAAWANELADGEGRVGVELGAASVTSPGEADYVASMGLDIAAALQARNPHVKWTDQTHRGFLLLTLRKQNAEAEFFSVSTVASKDYQVESAARFEIAAGGGVLAPAADAEPGRAE